MTTRRVILEIRTTRRKLSSTVLSANEMADVWLQIMPENEHERETLRNGTANHLETKIISGLEHKVRQHPSVAGHVELARHYKLTGQLLSAVT